jgi:hypothetical protein
MRSIDIYIDGERTLFKPYEYLEGRVQWQLEKGPQYLELILFWRTEGKGTQDIGVADRLRFDNPGPFGYREFKIKLPEGPYSFSGKNISIIWNLELVLPKGEDSARKQIVISPCGHEIDYSNVIVDNKELSRKERLLQILNKLGISSRRR